MVPLSQLLADLVRHDLRLHRLFHHRLEPAHAFFPIFHPLLRLLEEAAVLFADELAGERLQAALAVADHADLHGIAQSDALGIQIDLHGASLARLGQELDVWE